MNNKQSIRYGKKEEKKRRDMPIKQKQNKTNRRKKTNTKTRKKTGNRIFLQKVPGKEYKNGQTSFSISLS